MAKKTARKKTAKKRVSSPKKTTTKKKSAAKAPAKPKRKPGRPKKSFTRAQLAFVYRFCLLGATNREIAAHFEVHERKVEEWATNNTSFRRALKKGREDADAIVGERLYQRACGYSHPDTHITNYQGHITVTPIIKHYAPDTGALAIWLKNRRRLADNPWKDRHEINMTQDKEPLDEGAQDLLRRFQAQTQEDHDANRGNK